MYLKEPSSLFIQLHYTNFVLLYQAFIHFHFFPLKYLTTFFPCNHHHFSSIILTLLHPLTFMYLHPPSKILCSFIILSSSKMQHPLSTINLYNVYSFSCPFNLSLSFITIIHFPIPLSISINPYSYTLSAILVSFFMYLHKSTFIYLLNNIHEKITRF